MIIGEFLSRRAPLSVQFIFHKITYPRYIRWDCGYETFYIKVDYLTRRGHCVGPYCEGCDGRRSGQYEYYLVSRDADLIRWPMPKVGVVNKITKKEYMIGKIISS